MFKKFISSILAVGVLAINFGFLFTPNMAMAASLTIMSDTVSNLTAGSLADHTIKFTTPTGVAAGATIVLTFDNSTNTGSVAFGDMDLQDDGVDVTLAGAVAGTTWAAVKTSATVITFTNGSAVVAPNSVITIKIGKNATGGVNQITNGVAGTTTLRVSGTFADTGLISMAIIANGVVAVSAEVLASISFTVSQNAIYFGNLRTGGNCFAQSTNPGYVTCPTTTEAEAFNMTAGTNATTGYTVSVQGDTLKSGATNSITPLAVSTAPVAGTEQFGLSVVATGGSGAAVTPYNTAGQFAYTGTATVPATVATVATPSATTTYSVRYLANIAALTEAGSYTTAHTYVATGNF